MSHLTLNNNFAVDCPSSQHPCELVTDKMGVFTSLLVISLIFSTFFQPFLSEMFTSTAQLSEHYKLEQSLDKGLRNYIKEEKQRLKKLKTILRLKKQQTQNRLSDLEDLKGITVNPVDALTTLSQFGEKWKDVGKQLRQRAHRKGTRSRHFYQSTLILGT